MKRATLHLNISLKNTRKRVFLDQMDHVVPWAALVEAIAPYCFQIGRQAERSTGDYA